MNTSVKLQFLKNTVLILLLCSSSMVGIAQTQTYVPVGDIIYPYRAAPIATKSGSAFQILYQNRNSNTIDSVVLKAKYWKVKLKIDSVQKGHFEYDNFTQQFVNQKIWVSVPTSGPEDMYDLIIYKQGQVQISKRSVKLVKAFPTVQRIIHISDTHVSRNWKGSPTDGYAEELELLDKFINVANIIAPDFVVVTGDLTHDYTRFGPDARGWGGKKFTALDAQPSAEEKFKNYYEGAKGYRGVQFMDAPVFSVTGNHDFYGMSENDHIQKALQWNSISGIRVYGVAYGDTRLMVVDNFLGDSIIDIPVKKPMSGLQGKVFKRFLEENGSGKIRLMAQHLHNKFDSDFINANDVKLVLSGHIHTPDAGPVKGTKAMTIRPGVVCRSGETERWQTVLGLFRIVTIDGSDYKFTDPIRFCVNPTVPYKDIKLNLTLDYKLNNTGKSSSNIAVVKNNLPVDLPNCHIRFVMKKGKYTVNGGRVQQAINSGPLTIVDVRADVNTNSSKTVTIKAI
jgi:predicted MPP superfamily phosphohydrolase